jgi:hypothetical protein
MLGARPHAKAYCRRVRDAFARYDRPEARLRFVITPK